LLSWNSSYANFSLLPSLFEWQFKELGITQASIWIQPLQRHEMTEHLRRDDANPQKTSENANPQTTKNYQVFCKAALQ